MQAARWAGGLGALALMLGAVWPARGAPGVSSGEFQRLKAGGTSVRELPVADGAALRATFFVAAPGTVARGVLWDTERFPEFMPGSRRVRVLEHTAHRQLTDMRGGEGPFTLAFVTERRLEPTRITWRAVRGDLKRNDGFWAFAPAPGGTLVTYQVHVTPRGPVPAGVLGFMQKQALPRMIEAVRRRIEARSHRRARVK